MKTYKVKIDDHRGETILLTFITANREIDAITEGLEIVEKTIMAYSLPIKINCIEQVKP